MHAKERAADAQDRQDDYPVEAREGQEALMRYRQDGPLAGEKERRAGRILKDYLLSQK